MTSRLRPELRPRTGRLTSGAMQKPQDFKGPWFCVFSYSHTGDGSAMYEHVTLGTTTPRLQDTHKTLQIRWSLTYKH